MYFSKHQDEEVQLKAVTGLGKQHIHVHVEGEGTYWLVGAVLELISHDFPRVFLCTVSRVDAGEGVQATVP